jgi:regulator of replication initiation timing
MRPSTSTGNLYFAPKLQSHPSITDTLQKDVEQLQKIVKTLIEENIDLQACFHENRALQADVKHLTKTVQELSDSNSALKTRLNLLEVWYARIKNGETQKPSNYIREQRGNFLINFTHF